MNELLVYFSSLHMERIFIAALLGAFIGWEREQHGRPAGLRTHILVCMGAAIMMLVSEYMYEKYAALRLGADSFIRVDPGRIGAQIITGMGFIGAGVIMKMGVRVQGLTTAACLWLTTGVGMSVGTGMLVLPVTATVLATLVLYYLAKAEKYITRDIHKTLVVWTKGNRTAMPTLENLLKGLNVTLSRYTYEERMEKDLCIYSMNVKMRKPELLMLATQAIRERVDGVCRIAWN